MGLVIEEAENPVLKNAGPHRHYDTVHDAKKFVPVSFAPKRVVVLSKTTRLQYEYLKVKKRISDDFNDETFLKHVRRKINGAGGKRVDFQDSSSIPNRV